MKEAKSSSTVDISKIAIVGMALRVPGARTPQDFWRNLREGVESITFFDDEELIAQGIDERILSEPSYVKAYGYLPDADNFDAEFFDMPPSEAGLLDPQHRVFLECCWECLEDGGYAGEHDLTVGVFGGVGLNYQHLSYLYRNFDELTTRFGSSMAVEFGMRNDFIASRVSYLLDLRGPSMTVQSACSTSLVAVHQAAQSIINGECDMALAGGLTINLTNKTGYFYTPGGIQSPDGHCRAFDANAEGTVGGNGGGVVLLKSLSDALRDRDHIYGVILGSSVKNDGSLKVGFTAPSVVGQADTIAEAISLAGVSADSIGYLEAHGTATRLGDPIEISALSRAFGDSSEKRGFCAIGSVKTNLGHLDAGAGIAGLIKAALSVKNKEIPPSLHYREPNAEIAFDQSPFYVNTDLKPWKINGFPRRAGVSSFGIGGTNAHVVLEEAPADPEPESLTPEPELLLLSAKSAAALERASSNLQSYLNQANRSSIKDVAHTLRVGRKAFPYRRALICTSAEDAVDILSASKPGLLSGVASSEEKPPVSFLFSGQGSQYVGMGRALFDSEPIYRDALQESLSLLASESDADLPALLYPQGDAARQESQARISETRYAQPLLFAVGYALAKLWKSWGIEPQSMIGHSIGELTAACLSGVFSLSDAAKIVAARGRLMQQMPRGAMLATPLAEDHLRAVVESHAETSIAALNAPDSTVLSGPEEAVQRIRGQLQQEGISTVLLETSHAFHSSMMDPVLKPFEEVVRSSRLNAPRIPFLSCVTGRWISENQARDAAYWAGQIRSPVRFDEGLRNLLDREGRLLIEVGPGAVLTRLVSRSEKRRNAALTVQSLPKRDESDPRSDSAFTLNSLSRLWLSGAETDWRGFRPHAQLKRVPLPTYPFEPRRFAIPEPSRRSRGEEPIGKRDIDQWFYVPTWKRVPHSGVRPQEAGDSHWLILTGGAPLADAFASSLRGERADVTEVALGSSFERKDSASFVIDPGNEADYVQLAEALLGLVAKPLKVVHFATLVDDSSQGRRIDRFDRMQKLGFYCIFHLMGKLTQCDFPGRLDLTVVSDRMHDVWDDGRILPEKSPINGLLMCLPQEKPGTLTRSIDIDREADSGSPGQDCSDLIRSEILRAEIDRMVAFRNAKRWVVDYEPVGLEARESDESRIRQGDVCLITGGMGNIGLTAAKHLSDRFKARIALLGRSGLPPEEEWESYLQRNDADPRIRSRIETLREIRAAGSEVMAWTADVADPERLQAVVEEIERKWGPVQAVFHAAADLSQALRTLDSMDRPFCETQFGAKDRGALALESVFQHRSARLMVLFSSISSALGGIGYAAYAASNHYLDALAAANNAENGKEWITINWDAWSFGEEGNSEGANVGKELASFALTPDEGMQALDRILASDLNRVVVSTGDLDSRLKTWVRLQVPKKEKAASPEPTEPEQPPSPAALEFDEEYVAPSSKTEQLVAELWKDLLEIDRISLHDDFLSLGGNSLYLISFVDKIKQKTGVSLTTIQAAGALDEVAALIDDRRKVSVASRLRSLLD